MKKVSVLEAKTHFFALVRRVEGGERFAITRDGNAVAELVPSRKSSRPFGIDDGKTLLAPDFDAPLPDEIARAFAATQRT